MGSSRHIVSRLVESTWFFGGYMKLDVYIDSLGGLDVYIDSLGKEKFCIFLFYYRTVLVTQKSEFLYEQWR